MRERSLRTAAIVAIGDEILSGLTTDTNSAHLAGELRALGIEVTGVLSAPDDPAAIERAFRRGLQDAQLVVSTGGLGPTEDDRTADAAARVAGVGRERDHALVDAIRSRFEARGREMPPSNARQADLPRGCTVLANSIGTAPGFLCEIGAPGGPRYLACLPGVPAEVRVIASEALLPWVAARRGDRRYASRIFSTFGLAESALGEALEGVTEPGEAQLAFRAAFPKIQARVTVEGGPDEDLEGRLDAIEARVRERLGRALYAVGDEGMEETVGRLLADRGLTLAVAESCTGGLIGDRLTDVPGSSAYFLGGFVAYHNASKHGMLAVAPRTIEMHGAVSRETAEAMARGASERIGAHIGLATSGIAGPGGGTPGKPVGTVCVALADERNLWSRRYDLGDIGRRRIKQLTAQIALNRLRLWLEGGGD